MPATLPMPGLPVETLALSPSPLAQAVPPAAATVLPLSPPSSPLPVDAVAYLAPSVGSGWEQGLDEEAAALLATDRTDVWDVLTARFESRLILAALAATRGRRIEAAQKLGIGRNTITRKIQELGLE